MVPSSDMVSTSEGTLIAPITLISINTLRPRQNGRHFADDIFKGIFFNENVWILIKISLKFVPKGSINNIPAMVQIMAWCRPGDKPLSEAMIVSLLMHICITRPQWVNMVPSSYMVSTSAGTLTAPMTLISINTWGSKQNRHFLKLCLNAFSSIKIFQYW